MKHTLKRALAVFLAFIMVFGGALAGTIGASAETSGVYTYEVIGGKATITDCDTSAAGSLTIPAMLGVYPVTSIGNWAFNYCNKLTSVSIPNSVTSIGYDVFGDCDNLAVINVDENNPNFLSVDGILYNKNKTTLIQCPAVKASINIESSVTVIESYAFSGCKNLTAISIPNGVAQLEPTLFISCTSLVTINIPASVTEIYSALNGCSSLLAINVDASNSDYSSIDGVLYDKNQTNLITVPCAATSVNIPSKTTSIDFFAFSNCAKLTAITVDVNNLNYSNADGILYNNDKSTLIKCPATKTSVTIPNSVSFIGKSAFEGNVSMTSIIIPGTVATIGDSSFESCSKLAKVTILNGVRSIGDWAFSFNSKPIAVAIPDSVTFISDSAFSSFYDPTIYGNEGSYAQTFALAKGFTFVVGDLPRNTYAVTFNANGGSGAPTAQTKTEGVTLNLNSTQPTRTGYTFVGWATNATATVAQYQPGDSYTMDAALALYAVWQANTYTITYDANGGTGAPAFQTKTENVALTLSATAPTKTYTITYDANSGIVSPSSKSVSCTFNSWNTAQNGSGTSYAPSASYTVNANVTLYARWTNPAAGTLSTPTKTGWSFEGWFVSAVSETPFTAATVVSSDITLFARWQANSYTIHFLDGNTPLGSITLDYDQTGTLSYGSVPQKTFYDFVGWSITDGGPALFADGQSIKNLTAENNGSVSYYAVWNVQENTNVVKDDATGVELVYPDDAYDGEAQLSVEKVLSGTAFDIVESKDGVINPSVFNIKTTVNGSEVQPSGAVQVKIPIPEDFDTEKCKLYYINTNAGTVEEIAFTVENGYIIFITTHFSYWAIAEYEPCVNSVSLNAKTLSMNYKSDATLTASVDADDGANYLTSWNSSNNNVVKVDQNGKLTAMGTGTATITVTTDALDGSSSINDTCTVTVKLVWWQWLIKILLFGWIWY